MYSRYNCFALHNNVLLYIMLLCKGEHLTERRKPTSILYLVYYNKQEFLNFLKPKHMATSAMQ